MFENLRNAFREAVENFNKELNRDEVPDVVDGLLRQMHEEVTDAKLQSWVFTGLYTQGVFLVSIPLAFIDTSVAMYFWITAVFDRPVERLVLGKRKKAA